MSIAVVLNTHENSPVFQDTLHSVIHYLTNDVLVVVDGFSWDQFEKLEIPACKVSGFPHGKSSAPFRNVALGLSKAWETWGDSKKWYCYLEYDCLVGSNKIEEHLKIAEEMNLWLIGNDLRKEQKKFPFIENFLKSTVSLHYFLGCCLFFNSDFLKILHQNNFFEKFLSFTNFHNENISMIDNEGKSHLVYDLSEFLYPTLAIHYGGKINELACWDESSCNWRGNFELYPMRFRPDITLSDPYLNSCVMHPLKTFDNPVRQYHRGKRHAMLEKNN